jgi:hypothetical protein
LPGNWGALDETSIVDVDLVVIVIVVVDLDGDGGVDLVGDR